MKLHLYLIVGASLALLGAGGVYLESTPTLIHTAIGTVGLATSLAYKVRHDFYAHGKAALVVSRAIAVGAFYGSVIFAIIASLVLMGTLVYNAVFLPISLLA